MIKIVVFVFMAPFIAIGFIVAFMFGSAYAGWDACREFFNWVNR